MNKRTTDTITLLQFSLTRDDDIYEFEIDSDHRLIVLSTNVPYKIRHIAKRFAGVNYSIVKNQIDKQIANNSNMKLFE